jgi:hypothetical protein
MNIEKEFYERINNKFGECSKLAYYLAEKCALTTSDLERFLIRSEVEEQIEKGKKSKMMIYADIAEKYCKSIHSVIYIVKKI